MRLWQVKQGCGVCVHVRSMCLCKRLFGWTPTGWQHTSPAESMHVVDMCAVLCCAVQAMWARQHNRYVVGPAW